MRSVIASLLLGLCTLVPILATDAEAQAQRGRYGGGGYRGGYYGRSYAPYNYGYYGYYPRSYNYGYYNSGYVYPRTYSYYEAPVYESPVYVAPATSRYDYYWSNGWYICYDRVSGQYWYSESGSWVPWY